MSKNQKSYSDAFKRQVIEDFFESRMSQATCARKWNLPKRTLNTWLSSCKITENVVPLRHNSNHMDAKDQAIENLRAENERLRREVEYNKLRVAGYERLLEIVKQEDGIDLLKKDGAKQ